MRRLRSASLAAALACLAATSAQAQSYPMPAGATTVAAWSYMGPKVCARGPDPSDGTWAGAPFVDYVCLTHLDAWAYRGSDGMYYLRATTDLPFVDTYVYFGTSLYYDDDTFGVGVTDWPFDYQFGTGRDWNPSGIPYGAWLAAEGAKPQEFVASYDYIRWITEGIGSPESPFPEYVYAQFESKVWLQPVAISAVPEPATVGLVALGVGLVGVIARRRRRA